MLPAKFLPTSPHLTQTYWRLNTVWWALLRLDNDEPCWTRPCHQAGNAPHLRADRQEKRNKQPISPERDRNNPYCHMLCVFIRSIWTLNLQIKWYIYTLTYKQLYYQTDTIILSHIHHYTLAHELAYSLTCTVKLSFIGVCLPFLLLSISPEIVPSLVPSEREPLFSHIYISYYYYNCCLFSLPLGSLNICTT